jgi:AAA domain
MTGATERILDHLDNVKQAGQGAWIGSCPVDGHGQGRGDRNPSLAIRYDGEKVLVNCHGGCHPQDVLLALGLDWPDLFDEPVHGRGVTVAAWTYTDRIGNPYFTVERIQKPSGKSFAQRLPDADQYGLPAGFKPSIYKLPQVLAAIENREEVWIVEGEKCVSAAERLGVVATTCPMGAGKWRDYYSAWFAGCVRANIVCDNDDQGRRHAASVAVSLRGKGIPVCTYQTALDDEKADLYDHVQAGYGLDDLRPIKLNQLRPPGITLNELAAIDYPPIRWAIRGLLPTGFAILGGPPKLAKSMTALDMALGVAHGQRAMSELRCEQGSVLYLSLDNDSERRLQYRITYLLGDRLDPQAPIEFHCDWPTGEAAVMACQEWIDDELDAHRPPLLIVVDTLGKVEPHFEGNGYDNAYLASTANLSRWSKFANDNDVAVLAVHHDRKAGTQRGGDTSDWLDRFTGSRGITATASTLMMLEAKRGEPTGWLRVAGRDLETDDLELQRSGWAWVCLDQPQVGLKVV